MTDSLYDCLLARAEVAGLPGDLPDLIRLELLGELCLSGGTRTYSPHSEVVDGLADRFNLFKLQAEAPLPFPGLTGFMLPDAALRRCSIADAAPADSLLWVHPDSLGKPGLKNRGILETADRREVSFYPLASHRALLFRDGESWRRVKVHLQEVRISRYFRNLGGRTICHSVAVSREVKEHWAGIRAAYDASDAGTPALMPGFFLDEVGTIIRNFGRDDSAREGEWGCIERSYRPIGLPGDWVPLPLFAFYGRCSLSGMEVLMPLAVLLARQEGGDPEDLLFRYWFEPVIRLWVAVFRTTGIIWEAHGQNVVMMCDPETLMPRGVAFRDPDTAVSRRIRESLGLSCDSFFDRNVHGSEATREMPAGAASEISRVLDISMGVNTFDYLARLFSEQFGCSVSRLQERCRALFAWVFPEAGRCLPSSVYGYARQSLPEDRNCYPLEVRPGLRPVWRPATD